MSRFQKVAFTPGVKDVQSRLGSRDAYGRAEGKTAGDSPDALGDEERAFLAERDSFYLASVGEGGWPYVQHRGGPKGFVKVFDRHTLAFADYRGNKQYISVGNIEHDDRVALIFVDYPNRARLKVLARASIVTGANDPEVIELLSRPVGGARIERAFVLRVEGYDWNCPQHITPRYTVEEMADAIAPIRARIEALEEENRALRAALASAARDGGSVD